MRYNKGAVFAIASSALFSSVAIGATFAPSTLAAFTDTTASTANSAAAGTLNIDVVDGAGNASSAARVTVTNASPSMALRGYTLNLKNSGTLDAAMRIHTANLVASEHNLNDVLKVQVYDQLNNNVFSGKIADLDFTLANLPANASTIYTLKVTWPDEALVDDNPYMGATLNFDLTADASSIAGQ